METEKCEATVASCVCKLDKHPPDVFHECIDEICDGSWNGTGDDFVVARFPLTGSGDPLDAMLAVIGFGGFDGP